MLSFPFYRNGIEGIQNCLLRTLRVSSKSFCPLHGKTVFVMGLGKEPIQEIFCLVGQQWQSPQGSVWLLELSLAMLQ